VNEASTLITEAAHEEAEIIFGAVIDESLGDEVRVTVIATGFGVDQVKLGVPQHYSYQAQQQPQGYIAQPQAQYYQPQYQQVAPQPMAQAMPPIPPMQQHAYQAPVPPPVMAQPQVVVAPAPPPVIEEIAAPQVVPEAVATAQYSPEPLTQQQMTANSRDMLIAKAKAYREQALKQREVPVEQLSMEMSLDHAAAKAAVDLSSPFDQSNLDVPTYLRRKQRAEESPDSM
jgi:cell division protein FtsZ